MIVIADDITGAAEIAGIAHATGHPARLLCGCPAGGDSVATGAVTVIATDTRSMAEGEAAAETRRIISPLSLEGDGGRLLFKKTDSALRGHVVAELTALMQTTGYQRAVYLPANPSKERTIRNGIYYIKGVPIADTAFSYDPEFPAHTSSLKERFPDAGDHGIIMPDAESTDDIRRVIERYDDGKTLFAGAADLFTAFLPKGQGIDRLTSSTSHTSLTSTTSPTGLSRPSVLILCGSTQSRPLDLGIPVAPMPREVYDGERGADYWYQFLTSHLSPLTSLILTIPHTHRTGKEVAVHLRTVMAEMTRRLVSLHCPDQLIVEGGATAWATLNALGWHEFQIERQAAPGVVQMSATNGTLVTLKPGSYPWGGLFQSFSE
ncbi:MAG: hypothetical protein J5913_05065 [Prevotella sp.]|nr:hypothetical protein [Prevotella sp.]